MVATITVLITVVREPMCDVLFNSQADWLQIHTGVLSTLLSSHQFLVLPPHVRLKHYPITCAHIHGEPQLLDALLAISGPGCWLVIVPLQQVSPHQETRLPLLRPVLHNLGNTKTESQMTTHAADVWPFLNLTVCIHLNMLCSAVINLGDTSQIK